MSDVQNSSAPKIVVGVLAVTGGFAILGAIGMAAMHFGMMGRWSC
ncbi:hypothetical protein [Polaromonas sp. JS666]|nr:hypothetical protein [Polaromonas sp. JS666]